MQLHVRGSIIHNSLHATECLKTCIQTYATELESEYLSRCRKTHEVSKSFSGANLTLADSPQIHMIAASHLPKLVGGCKMRFVANHKTVSSESVFKQQYFKEFTVYVFCGRKILRE